MGNLSIHSQFDLYISDLRDFPGGSDDKASAYNVGDPGSIPGSGRSPGGRKRQPTPVFLSENPMDGGAW